MNGAPTVVIGPPAKGFMGRSNFAPCLCGAVWVIAIGLIAGGLHASAQAPSAEVSFEVATVKLVDVSLGFSPKHFWAHVSGGRASYWSMSPVSLFGYAYDLPSFQIAGPEWASAERFDIEARLPEGAGKGDDRRMLQALLKERFKFAFHIEQRQIESYALVVGKHGAKLKPSAPDPVKAGGDQVGEGSAKQEITRTADGASRRDLGSRGIQTVKFDSDLWAMHWEETKMTVEDMTARLGTCLGHGIERIVDETGIKGTYQLAWDCPSPSPRPRMGGDAAGGVASEPEGGSALERSLDAMGLRLEKRKVMVDVYVIDRVERPLES